MGRAASTDRAPSAYRPDGMTDAVGRPAIRCAPFCKR
jgi:hypothetical protein